MNRYMEQHETLFVEAEVCRKAGIQALLQAGAPADHAAIQVDLLLEAELRGRASHGLQRLPRLVERIGNGVLCPRTKGRVRFRSESFLEVDGEAGFGPVVALNALDIASERARASGLAVACIRNNNHLGMLAYYAERVAKAEQILIALSTSEALVHPWGGRKAMLGTNPIAIGVPSRPTPFVLDMATSLVSMGQIHAHAHRGQPLEPGWALDERGDPTLDASAAKDGAIAPFGDAKGYALGLGFELLVATLTDSALGTDVKGTLDSDQLCNKGDVFIVVDPTSSSVASRVSAYLDSIRACPPSTPGRSVTVPGDRANRVRSISLKSGVELNRDVWMQIQRLATAA